MTRGPRRRIHGAAHRLRVELRAPLERWRHARRPPRASAADVAAALGGEDLAEALARVRRVLPAPETTPGTQAIHEHVFDLLGSGPTALGTPIDWLTDFRSGRAWPLDHHTRIRVARADGSDIKVVWELSRMQHLPLLAAAGGPADVAEMGAQLESWIAANPPGYGPNWASAMEVAIRGANWTAAVAVLDDGSRATARWLDGVLASLLLHGRWVAAHRAGGPVGGNHHLAETVGLLAVAVLFAGGREGRRWLDRGVAALEVDMRRQVRPDGCHHEASTAYHRFVTELFETGAGIADALAPGRLSPAFRERLGRMQGFLADAVRPDGVLPLLGDSDDGCLLPRAGDDRRPARGRRSAAYPDGGFWILRAGDLWALVRMGDVGLGGLGCHAHNDLLSFELCAGDQPLVVDPGSYVYTADPAARDRFRSTAAHATVQVGTAEQRPIAPGRVFSLPDTATSRLVAWEPGAERTRWVGEITAFHELGAPVVHRRELVLDAGGLTIRDALRAPAGAALTWRFPLAGGEASADARGVTARIGARTLRIEGPLAWRLERAWRSPSYGVRTPVPVPTGTGVAAPRARPLVLRLGCGPCPESS